MAIHINTLNGGDITITTEGSTPASHPETRFTLQDGTVETYNIEGEFGYNWWQNHPELFDDIDGRWLKTIVEIDVGTSVTNLLTGCCTQDTTSITITGNGQTIISPYAFSNLDSLTNVTIGSGVMEIMGSVFEESNSITNVTIDSEVMYIYSDAFVLCNGLTSVVFQGRTLEQVHNIEDDVGNKSYPFGISNTSIISVN